MATFIKAKVHNYQISSHEYQSENFVDMYLNLDYVEVFSNYPITLDRASKSAVLVEEKNLTSHSQNPIRYTRVILEEFTSFGGRVEALQNQSINLTLSHTPSKNDNNLGSVTLNLDDNIARDRGEWVSDHSYIVGDIVTKNDNVCRCKTANSDTTFDPTKWDNLTDTPA